jgi:hypothetical protein
MEHFGRDLNFATPSLFSHRIDVGFGHLVHTLKQQVQGVELSTFSGHVKVTELGGIRERCQLG